MAHIWPNFLSPDIHINEWMYLCATRNLIHEINICIQKGANDWDWGMRGAAVGGC